MTDGQSLVDKNLRRLNRRTPAEVTFPARHRKDSPWHATRPFAPDFDDAGHCGATAKGKSSSHFLQPSGSVLLFARLAGPFHFFCLRFLRTTFDFPSPLKSPM